MAISRSGGALLLQTKKIVNFQGSLLQLGRQWVYFSYAHLLKMAKMHNITLRTPREHTLSHDQNYAELNYINEQVFFDSLGFDVIHSLDLSDNEKPTFIHNLNYPVSTSLHNQYDVIIDGGTSEHVFNLPQVLANIHNMLKENGIIIHKACPLTNHVDHGYYMFSPSLFYEYYLSNQYEILQACIIKMSKNVNKKWQLYDYHPAKFYDFQYGGFDNSLWGNYFVCQKTKNSTSTVVPNQGCCNKLKPLAVKNEKKILIKVLEKIFKKKIFPKKTMKI